MTNTYDRFNSWTVLCYSDKLIQIAKGEIPYPVVWHIYPSNICPYNCNFCIMKEEKSKFKTMLKKKTLFKVIEDASRVGSKLIHFSGGGEPLTHPNIEEAILLARKKD